MTLGERLDYAIKQSGMKKKDVAEKIGITPSSITQIISGQTVAPTGATILSLCNVLGISRIWLETGDGEMRPPKSREDQVMAILADIAAGEGGAKARLVHAIAALPDDACVVLADVIIRMAKELQEETKTQAGE